MINLNPYLQAAINEIDQLHCKEKFIVKDLFKGYAWNRIPKNERLTLGSLFLDWVNNSNSGVQKLEKNSSHQQMYRKL
ncbi:single-stranded DNA-binding protein [Sporosarcina sp. P17b]|uniref:single-stranded DNA-binding protein n=1 Tax=Sporosarcina sp. P17b TaxID=2048260 RepID=UPI000C1724E9|nr:single-stranded DNA-binding protein [Sporosarcina sp. P17b]PIC73711.1 hypothetical protein CSV76_07265 [Sporosarcina sp. P17b]